MNDDSLSPRYYVAEATVWLLGAIIFLLRFVGVAPAQAVPILNIELADHAAFPRVVAAVLAAALIYFWVEWQNANTSQRRSYITLLWGCLALWTSYSLVTAGTSFEGISTRWYIAAIVSANGNFYFFNHAALNNAGQGRITAWLPRAPRQSRLH